LALVQNFVPGTEVSTKVENIIPKYICLQETNPEFLEHFQSEKLNVAENQGDQIGRSFASWAIFFYFWQIFKVFGKMGYFSTEKRHALFNYKNGLGDILGNFFSQTHLVAPLRTDFCVFSSEITLHARASRIFCAAEF
jgi:hypothetical protein